MNIVKNKKSPTYQAVNRDIQFLQQQARQSIQKYIHRVVPEEYQICMIGMRQNFRRVLKIVEAASDPKTKLEARRIANECYRYIIDLCTNAGIVLDMLKYVTQKQEQINTLQTDKRIGLEAAEKETTTNGVF